MCPSLPGHRCKSTSEARSRWEGLETAWFWQLGTEEPAPGTMPAWLQDAAGGQGRALRTNPPLRMSQDQLLLPSVVKRQPLQAVSSEPGLGGGLWAQGYWASECITKGTLGFSTESYVAIHGFGTQHGTRRTSAGQPPGGVKGSAHFRRVPAIPDGSGARPPPGLWKCSVDRPPAPSAYGGDVSVKTPLLQSERAPRGGGLRVLGGCTPLRRATCP